MGHGSSVEAASSISRKLFHRVSGLACGLLVLAATLSSAQAEQSVLGQGNAVVTGFSGVVPSAVPASAGDPSDSLYIDLNGTSARILDLQINGQAPQGQVIPSPTVLAVKAGDVGQVFGIALDDGKGPDGTAAGTPDIYLTASSAFGLQIVTQDSSGHSQRLKLGQAGAQWMPGQWGDAAKSGTPGSIWKVSGTTGQVSLFANVVLNGQPNSGPGLGNVAFDATSRQLFVSDLETGMIHRFDMHGQDLGYYDHGTQGRISQGLSPVPYDPANRLDITNPAFSVDDPATWHYAQKGRTVWGLKVSSGRLYYATAEGPQVWSISIGADGSFGNDARMEIDVTGTPNNNAISDVTFNGPDTIYLAQRGAARGDYTYKTFAEPAKSDVLRYHRDPQTGKWTPQFEEYAVGFPPELRNTNGGVAVDTCNNLVWTTGELLRQGSGLGNPENVHGLQGMDKGLVRPANAPPKQSYFAEYNPQFEDADAHGHMGDVEVWHPCQQSTNQFVPTPPVPPSGSFNLTLTKVVVPYICPPGVYCMQPPQGSNPDDCVPGGQGWLCSYKILVTNTGSTPYSGPVTVDDWLPQAPSGAIMTFSPQPPWACSMIGTDQYQCIDPLVVLNPGDSVELDVVVDLPQSYEYCYLDNVAQLDWGNDYGDANPADDGAYASAHIPGSHCPPPQGNKTNLRLQKFAYPHCVPFQGGYLCRYLVWVTNTGPGVYNDKITVADTLPAGDTLIAVSPPWACVGGPPTYQCTHATVTLNPGQGRGFFAWVKVPANYDKPQCEVTNHAHITWAPGGSDENTNPGDDDASATAKITSDQCLGQKTNLKLEKFPGTCSRYDENGEGWDCTYLIKVTDTGPGTFLGDITVKDNFGGIAQPANFPAPWTCSGAAGSIYCTLSGVTPVPSGYVSVVVHGKLPAGGHVCALTNNASIQSPVGGSAQNTDPNDDSASAVDKVPDPSCQPIPLGGGDTGHISILKICKPAAVGAGINCSITVTNDGGQPISGQINFGDKGQWTGNGTTMHVLAVKPDSPAVTCSGMPDALNCTLPGSALPPGTSHSVELELAAGDGQVRYKNCAMLLSVDGSPLTGPGHESCVTGGGDISVIKTGPATCIANQNCAFQVAIINNNNAPFSGPVLIGDTLLFGNTAQFDLPITVIPSFGCPVEPTTLQFNCIANVSLAPHEQQLHTISVQMPPAQLQSDGLNCFFATDGSRGLPGPKVLDPSTAGFLPHPGNGPGYSCVPFKLVRIITEQKIVSCPGDEVRIGTQCQCPPGTRAASNFRCIGGGGGVVPLPTCHFPLVGIFPDCHCPSTREAYVDGECRPIRIRHCDFPAVGDYPNCHCPDHGVFDADSNTCIPRPPLCAPPMYLGDDQRCHCPRGTVERDGRCVPPDTTCPPPRLMVHNECVCPRETPLFVNGACTRPPRLCTPPMYLGDDQRCHCPRDTIERDGRCVTPTTNCPSPRSMVNNECVCPKDMPLFVNGVCTRPHLIFCRFPLVSKPDGSCGCPADKPNLVNGQCMGTVTHECPRGAIGTLPNCTCPSSREVWNGRACVLKTPTGGNTNCNGTMVNGVCITKQERACPRPAIGTMPNCVCPGGETWNGSTCVKPIKINPSILKNLHPDNNTGSTTHTCPTGQRWNGRACVAGPGSEGIKNIPGLGGDQFKIN